MDEPEILLTYQAKKVSNNIKAKLRNVKIIERGY